MRTLIACELTHLMHTRAGHADVLSGILVLSDATTAGAALIPAVRSVQQIVGSVASPFDCFLVMRGMRSLLPRMRMHSASALRVATYLSTHPRIVAVFYPGLPSHAGHAIVAAQYTAAASGASSAKPGGGTERVNGGGESGGGTLYGGMLSVRVAGGQAGAVAFTNALRVFTRATSLGGTESLVEHRRSVEGAASASPDDLIRVSIGLEDPGELIEDMAQALGTLPA